ncbi:MAG: PrsW family intramembrane metalloprotease [Bacteroidetes bacterium]|nr:PrsW family intramembrane metalloprotease [Bacteroidota bacterium]
MEIFLLLAMATAPGFAIMMYIYFKDKYEREPFGLLMLSFWFGVFSILLPAIVETMSGLDGSKDVIKIAIYSFAVVGLSEETSKFMFLRIFIFKRKAFNEPLDGIVYSIMIGMGFATAENVMYVLDGGFGVGILRMLTAVPAHACFAVFMGYFVGMAKFKKHKFIYLALGLITAVVAHGFYDFFLLQEEYDSMKLFALVVLSISIFISIKAILSHRKASPFKDKKEVDFVEEDVTKES